jgi:CTP synthase
MVLSGQSPDGRLVEIVELKDHPWFVASQFHPEFKSRPERPHPLFDGFVKAALKDSTARGQQPAHEEHAPTEVREQAAAPAGQPEPAEPGTEPARTSSTVSSAG